MSIQLPSPTEQLPLPDLARQLAHDGLELARAEAALAQARMSPEIGIATRALVFIVGGAILALLAAIGLTVGLVLQLAASVGPSYAGLIVGGAGLAIAGMMAWFGAHQLSNLLTSLKEKLR